jgi:hypothetical protein
MNMWRDLDSAAGWDSDVHHFIIQIYNYKGSLGMWEGLGSEVMEVFELYSFQITSSLYDEGFGTGEELAAVGLGPIVSP